MHGSRHFSITLPHDVAEAIDDKVRSGDYASASDVVRDGVSFLIERDAAMERWLREDVVQSYDEYMADPSTAVPADQVMERLRARAKARKTAGPM